MAKGTRIAAMNMARAAEDEFHDWTSRRQPQFRDRLRLVCRRYVRRGERHRAGS